MKKTIFILILLCMLGAGTYYFRDLIFPGRGNILKIVVNTEVTDISPYSLNLDNITRIQNIYEGLVAFDRNLKIVPALAVGWGNLSDTRWEFRLREGVKFHDGSLLTAQDVVDSFDRAKNSGNIQIAGYIDNIETILTSENNRIIVVTKTPDPLLLSKLTKLFILKENNVGTGPYLLDEWIAGKRFSLKAFSDYWGRQPAFKRAHYEVITNRADRKKAFANGDIDLLVGLTEDQAMELPREQIITSYGLEVNFLMFRLNDPLFEDRNTREAILTLIDPEKIEEIGNRFVRSNNQFIAQGVYGYNQNIPVYDYRPEKEARSLFGKRLERLSFDYLPTYSTLAQYLVSQLKLAGFSVNDNALEPSVLMDRISRNESQLFLVGWRAEDGDAGGFFDAFIHSEGPFNNGRYKNDEIDRLIEESRAEMDPKKRLVLLQEINALITQDLIGIPLFETSRLFALKKGIKWEPRLDGQVLASEISR